MESVKFRHHQDLKGIDLLVIPYVEGAMSPLFQTIESQLEGGATAILQKTTAPYCLITSNGKSAVPRLLFVRLKELSELSLQDVGGGIIEHLGEAQSIALDGSSAYSQHLFFGMLLRAFNTVNYKTKNKAKKRDWFYLSDDPVSSETQFQETQRLLQSVALAKNLTAEPANKLNPRLFMERCLELRSLGLSVEVLDAEALLKAGMHAILAVGQGSVNPPYVVILRWEGGEGDPIAFVGKGVCFDAGGINIKTQMLTEMKWDKAGASTVVGLMHMLAISKTPVNAIGIIGLVENMVDGAAQKPGDVINTHAGLTVEIVDTDSEGRLVLCDCLSYAQTITRPSAMIDLGTLTPEVCATLAGEYAGLYSNNAALTEKIVAAGNASGERVWPLPMGEAYAKQLVSEEADMKNCGTVGFGESAAAAEYLHHFVKPETPWVHLDIAGVAWTNENRVLCAKGVTGFGVRLLYSLVKQVTKNF